MANDVRRNLFVAIVGVPNSGKSTLVNLIVGEKISIVSPKVQTTRRRIRGIANFGEVQLVFTDTPGFFFDGERRLSKLESIISSNFWKSSRDSDLILLLIDSTVTNLEPSVGFLEKMEKARRRVVVAINKVDIAKKENILKIASLLSKFACIDKIFMISAFIGDGVTDLVEYLKGMATEGPWLFGDHQSTDADMKFRLSEITREKLFLMLSNELPYSAYVETEFFAETEKKAKIHQAIVVMKDSQKPIVIGHEGKMIRIIREMAGLDMKSLLNKKKLELRIFVKVRKKWVEKKEYLLDAGIIDN
ncbi:MAG: GTPase Era [Holosporales bacterium]|jgi:GTP-binding protein Era|nr:GTPase Era [Holosporales bacterium]